MKRGNGRVCGVIPEEIKLHGRTNKKKETWWREDHINASWERCRFMSSHRHRGVK